MSFDIDQATHNAMARVRREINQHAAYELFQLERFARALEARMQIRHYLMRNELQRSLFHPRLQPRFQAHFRQAVAYIHPERN